MRWLAWAMVASMKRGIFAFGFLVVGLGSSLCRAEQPTAAAVAAFEAYAGTVEARLAKQHAGAEGFLAAGFGDRAAAGRLHDGQVVVERLAPTAGPVLPGAMLHHWRATVFVPGAEAGDFDRMMREVSVWPRTYAPEVVAARVIAGQGDRYRMTMRVRQRHVLTVTMDTSYDVTLGQIDPLDRFSTSRSTQISEIGANGEALSAADEHGYLWRQNTYWSCAERNGGVYLQVESISLTRAIPTGLAWAIGPFVESVPRESLEFTLRATGNALRRRP
jgi:hypothetical protein